MDGPKQRHGCLTAWLILMIVVLGISILRFNGVGTDAILIDELTSAGMTIVQGSSILPIYAVWIASVICLVLLFTKSIREVGSGESGIS